MSTLTKPILFRHAATLLAQLLASARPADKQIEQYFRARRELGLRDRGWIAETVYGVLRRRRFLEHLSTCVEQQDASVLVAGFLASARGYASRALSEAGYTGDAIALTTALRTLDRGALPLGVQFNLPDELLSHLMAQYGASETAALAQALNEPAPLDLRVNTLKADREAVAAQLREEGVATDPTPYAPTGLRVRAKTALFGHASFQAGLYEIQDEGSQLVTQLLEVKRREHVADYCAGGGGKTLHLAALMGNTGSITACEVTQKRLDGLKPRLKRAGVDTVRLLVVTEGDERLQRLMGKMDRVLVDAPCTGTGTLRRNPDMKWRPLNLPQITARQRAILTSAAPLVKPGGRLVYVTCSVLREENQAIIEDFLAAHADFSLIPVTEIAARRRLELPHQDATGMLTLLPHRHGTDGFFAAALARAAV